MKQKNLIWLDATLLALLIVPTFWFRFSTLDSILFGIDECFHFVFACKPTIKEMFASLYAVAPQQFPLDYLINFAAVRFTTDLYQLRLLPLFWGTCSIALCYFLGKLLWNRTFGWFWAWLMATSPLHMCYSQILRPYSLIVFLSLLFLFAYFKSLKETKWIPIFGVVSFLFQMAYPFALAFSMSAILHSIWIKNKNHSAITVAAVFSWSFPLIWFLKEGSHLFSQHVFNYGMPTHWLNDFALSVLIPFGGGTKGLAIFFVLAFFIGIAISNLSYEHRGPAQLGILLLILAGALIMVSMRRAHLFLEARHFISLLPIFLGFIAVPLTWISRNLIVSVVTSFLTAMLCFPSFQGYLAQQANASHVLRDGSQFLRNAAKPGDLVVYGNPNTAATFLYYYDKTTFLKITDITISKNGFNLFKLPDNIFTLCSMDPSIATIDREKFNQVRANTMKRGGRIWLLSSPINYIDESPPFPRALDVDPANMRPVYPGIFLLTEGSKRK